MIRIVITLALLLALQFPAAAQDTAPDYSIQLIQSNFSDDVAVVEVKFDVLNEGASTRQSTTASLSLIETGEKVSEVVVPPLEAGERHPVVLSFATSAFSPNSVESFRASVGVGDIEAADDQSVRDNSAVIQINFPATIPFPELTPEASPLVNDPTAEVPTTDLLDRVLDRLNVRIDRSDPVQVAVVGGVIGIFVLLILILIVIGRLLFQRQPVFGNWQPPYANLIPSDISTVAGRRQQWQAHAQNSSLPVAASDGSLHVRKLPGDDTGLYLAQWHILAVRFCQYDMYGRVNRSQVMLTGKLTRRVDWVARKKLRLTESQMSRHLRPVARFLSRQVRKRLNERTAGLPLVLDVRLRAKHDRARIWFELFRSQQGRWSQIDRWPAEMVVPGKMIYESFTYTLYGQRPGEMLNQYQKRLEDDLLHVLTGMMLPVAAVAEVRPETPTDPHFQPVAPTV